MLTCHIPKGAQVVTQRSKMLISDQLYERLNCLAQFNVKLGCVPRFANTKQAKTK